MSANPVIYCLERLTDYLQFERLCSDLMSGIGYQGIEPIGGTGDRGRDAIYISKDDQKTTIFAYSVRSDWKVKLNSDCKRIHEEQHIPHNIVFVCTSSLSGDQKDKVKSEIKSKYGWTLEIYDLERIRTLLSSEFHHLIAQHPSIFCPPWFPAKGGLSISPSKDTIIIDHTVSDHALATWLFRRLTIAGYKVWCYSLAPLVGEDIDETVRILTENRAAQFIPIISHEAYKDPDFISRASSTVRQEDFNLPVWASDMSDVASTSRILSAQPAEFYNQWSFGLEQLLNTLDSRGIILEIDTDKGQSIALRAFMPEPVTKPIPEKVYANLFPVALPNSIFICELARPLDELELIELKKTWAFKKVDDLKYLSFFKPPKDVPLINTPRIAETAWKSYDTIERIHTINIVKELIKKSLLIQCAQTGLKLCDMKNVYYFPELEGKQHNISFTHVDGRKTRVAGTGVKQYGWGERAEKFRYQLSPNFRVYVDADYEFWIITRIYVRVTDIVSNPFEGKQINRYRKAVTKGWWNKEWLARTLGVMQAISTTPERDKIVIGSETKHQISISTQPLDWDCPISIDVEAVDRIGDFQEEMASIYSNDNDDQEVETPITSKGSSENG